jgi:hypothetical protein
MKFDEFAAPIFLSEHVARQAGGEFAQRLLGDEQGQL